MNEWQLIHLHKSDNNFMYNSESQGESKKDSMFHLQKFKNKILKGTPNYYWPTVDESESNDSF